MMSPHGPFGAECRFHLWRCEFSRQDEPFFAGGDPMVEKNSRGVASGDEAAADSRRAFIRRAAYVAPALLTLAAAPAMAQTGSRPPPPNCPPGEFPVWDPNLGMWVCES
jgi:hypothetical protein